MRGFKAEDLVKKGLTWVDQTEAVYQPSKPIKTPLAQPTNGIHFTIRGEPMGKPRQTRADVWKKRPCVMRYREWADSARAQAPANLPKSPWSVSIVAYLQIPPSWSNKRKGEMRGKFHQSKPDADNIIKSVLDALWEQDQSIAVCAITKFWEDGNGPRVEVKVMA